jgi:hypothetical protein
LGRVFEYWPNVEENLGDNGETGVRAAAAHREQGPKSRAVGRPFPDGHTGQVGSDSHTPVPAGRWACWPSASSTVGGLEVALAIAGNPLNIQMDLGCATERRAHTVAMVLPGLPKRCMCVGWETPFARFGNHSPNRASGRAQEQVVLGVAFVGLKEVVVDVLHADLGARPRRVHQIPDTILREAILRF